MCGGRSDYPGGVQFLVGVELGAAVAGSGEEVVTADGVAGFRCT